LGKGKRNCGRKIKCGQKKDWPRKRLNKLLENEGGLGGAGGKPVKGVHTVRLRSGRLRRDRGRIGAKGDRKKELPWGRRRS